MDILVVDDDAALLDSTATLLADCGYSITTADSAEAALSVLRSNGSLRVLLTDVVMPGMNGFELAEQARRVRPGLCVIYMTGYSRDTLPGAQQLYGPLLLKPWPLEQLLQELDRCLC